MIELIETEKGQLANILGSYYDIDDLALIMAETAVNGNIDDLIQLAQEPDGELLRAFIRLCVIAQIYQAELYIGEDDEILSVIEAVSNRAKEF